MTKAHVSNCMIASAPPPHRRFLGCRYRHCALCANNPHKRCGENDCFDDCYVDNQILKSKCDADIYVELVDAAGIYGRSALSGVEVQVRR